MPIGSSDIQYRLSGGAANADPAASLGGAISSVAAGTNYFDDVPSAEAAAGDVEYRCIYVRNGHASLPLIGAKAFIASNTPSASTDAAIGLGSSAIGGTEQAVANENAAPASVAFSSPADFASGLVIGDLAPGATKAIWVRRTVTAGAGIAADGFTVRVQGDTGP